MTARKPIPRTVPGLRQRRRADGSWRAWWEPSASAMALGFTVLELDPDRPTWSIREAEKRNSELEQAKREGARRPMKSGRTVEALIEVYLRHSWFTRLAPATQRDYRNALATIRAKWGDELAHHISKPAMSVWHETLAARAGAHQAVRMLRIMSRLMSFAEIQGWRPENSNPCLRLGMSVPKGRIETADWATLDALLAAADRRGWTAVAAAIALAMLNGMRLTDVLGARVDGFRDDPGFGLVWQFVRSKRRNQGRAPVHPEAAPRVRALLEAAPEDQVLLLIDQETGTPFTVKRFNDRWRAVRDEAARTAPAAGGLQFRDLRRSFGRLARAGGASRSDVGDMLGNSAALNPQLGEIYMATQLTTAARAVMSVQRPAPHVSGD